MSHHGFFERPTALLASYRLMPADGHRTTSFDREIPASFFVFDVLRSWGLPQLLASSRAESLIVNPIGGDGNRLPEPEARKVQPSRVRVISASEPDPAVKRFLKDVSGGRVRD
jgi:hypothetical protein